VVRSGFLLEESGDVMRTLLGGLLAALTFGIGVSAEDKKDENIDAKKLIGKWSPKEKMEGLTVVVEFTKDGKVTFTYAFVGERELRLTENYKVDGSKLITSGLRDPKTVTVTRTLVKLTDDELVTKDEKGKEQAFTRIKDK
jgi:uncharacterized protein (TIGR03066 family)